jgi:hypothetical protein
MNDQSVQGGIPKLPDWMKRRAGFVCDEPIQYNFQSEIFTRACGRCLRCQARDKRDTAGRAAAEAYLAADVAVFTLTYADGHEGAKEFVTEDRQNFLKRLRAWLHDEARREVGAPKRMPKNNAEHVRAYWKAHIAEVLPRVRYLGCGERGSRGTKRCHWHIVIFGSRPLGFTSTPKDAAGNYVLQKHPLWQKGWVTVDVLPQHSLEARMKAVRYCVKYLTKAKAVTPRQRRHGVPDEAKFFRSTATPLGFEYLTDHARRIAQAALPVHGLYRVPGVTNSLPPGLMGLSGAAAPARPSEFVLRGRMRDHYIAAYRAEWQRLRPEAAIPGTDWLRRHDPEYDDPATICRKIERDIGVAVVTVAPSETAENPGLLLIRDRAGFGVGILTVRADGHAFYRPEVGPDEPVRDGGLRHVAGLSEEQHVALEQWLIRARGPDWRDPREVRGEQRQAMLKQRALIQRFAKNSPNLNAHRPDLPEVSALTALRRKLILFGDGHIGGRVVKNVRDAIHAPPTISDDVRRLRSGKVLKAGKPMQPDADRAARRVVPVRGVPVPDKGSEQEARAGVRAEPLAFDDGPLRNAHGKLGSKKGPAPTPAALGSKAAAPDLRAERLAKAAADGLAARLAAEAKMRASREKMRGV